MSKASNLLASANEVAAKVETWADLSNALFDPEVGLVSRAYPTRNERAEFLRSPEYKKIRELIDQAAQRSGLVEGATPRKSGKFVVRLAKSLHAALENEAKQEGVSLNQLVVTKLAAQMSQIATGPHPELAAIAQAYLEVRDGYSADRVIADPELDRVFLSRCRELGLRGTDFELNWKLLYARKNRYLSRLPKTRRYTPTRIDEFEFSSEIAVRFVQRNAPTSGPSLDRILCDPDLAAEFDSIAARLAPDFTSLEYRWAALHVRKAAGRYWRESLKAALPNFDVFGSTKAVRASRIPEEQGVYLFRSGDDSIFVGETDNLRARIERHFDQSESMGIPRWLYDPGRRRIELGVASLPAVDQKNRKLIELRTVATHRPLFNVSRDKRENG